MSAESDEVAEDYRLALEDLSSNMRFEISNLTVIARENTEHALAIAEVLQQHILKAPPAKKLPALYVLDSIVKNIGTPYTLYFGRNLFKIFMESYAMVDGPVRKRMEDMLKTWKDPVPGSMDTRPVFSHELVRPIENALMRAHAASMPQNAMLVMDKVGHKTGDRYLANIKARTRVTITVKLRHSLANCKDLIRLLDTMALGRRAQT
ncbi:Uncharacterized protein C4G9.04c [Beauveria bassiana]|uniref:Uncharacterized protein C4G9.04c n=1 Tax=Beauveria bassiana TaxID=176275 RepID=A0A2N6NQN2_BEABA|nr:Uncharacterized protein C4G9.04c [Beauveria bassiana]